MKARDKLRFAKFRIRKKNVALAPYKLIGPWDLAPDQKGYSLIHNGLDTHPEADLCHPIIVEPIFDFSNPIQSNGNTPCTGNQI